MSSYYDFSNGMTDVERLEIIKRGNPDFSSEMAGEYLAALEQRYEQKQKFVERGFTNALAEKALDKQGWPRPFGWHSVFCYPGSNRPRNRYILFVIVAGFIYWKWIANG